MLQVTDGFLFYVLRFALCSVCNHIESQVTDALHKGNPDPAEKKLFMDVVKARVQVSNV